jgi:hypothetical protein
VVENEREVIFLQKDLEKVWWVGEKALPLQPLSGTKTLKRSSLKKCGQINCSTRALL